MSEDTNLTASSVVKLGVLLMEIRCIKQLERRKTTNWYKVYKPAQNVLVTVENFLQGNVPKTHLLRDDEFNHEDDAYVKVGWTSLRHVHRGAHEC